MTQMALQQKKHLFSNEQLRRLIIPLILEQLLAMLVGMVDTIMVSSAGEAAISGVSIVNDVNALAINLLAALAGGGAVIVSQYLGNHDRKNADLAASQLVLIATVISGGIAVLCIAFHRQILGVLYGSVASDVMEAACTYFWITALSFPFLGIYNSSAAIFRSMSMTKTTMYVSFVMNFINVVGNYIGVILLKMGAAGVAWPTLISRAVAAVIMVYLAFDASHPLSLSWKNIFSWHANILKRILNIAVPNSIENGLFQFGKILVSSIVSTFGTSQIAANGVANSLVTLAYTTEMSMNLAVVTVVGQCVGANDYDEAKYFIRKLVKWAWVMAIVSNMMLMFMFPIALNFYTLSAETAAITRRIASMECIAVALMHAVAFVLPTSLRAAGDARFTMYVGVCSMFAARVGGAFVFGRILGLGVIGTRLAMYLDWVVRIIFFVHRYRSGKWMNYRAI